MNKIIEKMELKKEFFSDGLLKQGYCECINDLKKLVKSETPPCSGSSVLNKDIRAGDYVETISGKVGYVYNISYSNENRCISVQLMNGDSCHYNQLLNEEYEYSKHFNRIGQYNFTKQDKIKPLEYDYEIIRGDGRILKQTKLKMDEDDIVNKINEIIKHINKEDE